MSNLRMPRLISDGMVLQRDRKVRIWGYDAPGRDIEISFLDDVYKTISDSDGYFEVWLNPHHYGGPYKMEISDDAGGSVTIEDILIGEVWLCSGQSNMELTMIRVRDRYPDEMVNCDYPDVRSFKISEALDFTAPVRECQTGRWRRPAREYISEFSATAYFFARELNKMTGIPVGYIDASLGGSKVHCWMSREMLEGYDDKLALADKYAPQEFRDAVLKDNTEKVAKWHNRLDSEDTGLKEHWESADLDDSDWDTVELPAFFKDTVIGDTLGCIYFRKTFDVPADMAGKSARLWLGTIVDSDKTYVNGTLVGQTEYQYPPRKYDIPQGLLHEGMNNVTVRMKSEYLVGYPGATHVAARFTPGKEYRIFNENGTIELAGTWKYKIGAVSDEPAYYQDFISWKPTGLYNAMTAPCHKYTIGGFNWYQGESDCEERDEYTDLFTRMVEGYRKEWNDPGLFAGVVQLPNFTIDNDPASEAWQGMREILRELAEVLPDSDSIVTIDLGEDNDLHPQGKRELGRRLALLAAHYRCGMDVEYSGPRIEKFMCVKKDGDVEITLNMSHVGDGMQTREVNGRGSDGIVTDFRIVDDAGNNKPADVTVLKDRLVLSVKDTDRTIKEIRYCYSQTNSGALIYNSDGLPMSPGIYRL